MAKSRWGRAIYNSCRTRIGYVRFCMLIVGIILGAAAVVAALGW